MSNRLYRVRILQPRFDEVYREYEAEFGSDSYDDISVSKKFANVDERLNACVALCNNGAYAEGVEKSFKIVRERLRALTGYETSSDAFGKGRIHISGAAAPHVDEDFNEGAKFLMMSIDRFRNEKSHTADGNIDNFSRAHQYLLVSSLALQLLDKATIKNQ